MTEEISIQAAEWLVALQSDTVDWDAFTNWLEADPRHRAEYDAIALLGEDLERNHDSIVSLIPQADEPHRSRRWFPAGIAASVVAALVLGAFPLMRTRAAPDQTYSAPRGTNRTITVADARITLAAGSRLIEVAGNATNLRLDGGAYFVVPHRSGRTLKITAGDYTVRDIGTTFEIVTTPASFRLAVSHGAVSVASAAFSTPVAIAAGRRLTVVAADGAAEITAIRPQDVASWRNGQLIYTAAPLPLVAAEISRYAGRTVSVAPSIANRRFSGTLTIGDGSDLARKLAEATGLRLDGNGDALRLDAADSG